MQVKILLADDHGMMRDGLRSIVENELHMSVIAEADNGRLAVELAKKLRPDVVVMDINMPDLNGIEATRQIIRDVPNTKVIALSMHSDRQYVSDMLGAGASGYLLKHSASDELELAIKAVLAKKTYISPDIAGVVIDDYKRHIASAGTKDERTLTPKEREILQLIAEGKSIKEIAALLHVSIPTIETHKQHVMEKIGLHTIAELTKYAIRIGLTSLE